MSSKLLLLGIIGLTVAVYLLDIVTPLGIAIWLLYLIPLALTAHLPQPKAPFFYAGLATVLVALGFMYSPPGFSHALGVFNRSLGLAMFWILAALLHLRQHHEETRAENQVHRDELVAELKRENEDLAVLAQAATNAGGSFEPGEALHVLLARLVDATRADTGVIFLVEGDLLRVRTVVDRQHEGRAGDTAPVDLGLAASIAAKRAPLYIKDAQSDALELSPFIQERGVRSVLGVPLTIGETLVGVLLVEWLDEHPYSEREERLLTIAAGRVAAAIANSHLFEELKQTEAERRREAEQFRLIVESAPNGMALIDRTGTIVMVNGRLEQQFGYDRGELLGQSIAMLVPLRLRPPHAAHRAAFLESPSARMLGAGRDLYGLRKDGTEFPAEIGLAPLDGPEPGRVLVSVADITERKRADAKLRERDVALANAMPCISRLDREGRYVDVNDLYARALGYEPHEMIGLDWIPTVHPNDRHLARSAYERMRREGKGEFEARAVRRDRSLFYNHVLLIEILDDRGEFAGHHGFMRDITERKQTEETIRACLRQQQAVADLGLLALSGCDVGALTDRAAALVAQTLQVDYCKVLELLPGGRELVLRSGVGWKEGLVGRARVSTGLESQAGYTLSSNEPVIVEDFRSENRFREPPLLREHGVVSGLSVIVHGRDGAWGVLGAHAARRRTFTRDDVTFLQAVANVLSEAIRRRQAEELEAWQRQFAELIASGAPLSETMNELVRFMERQSRQTLGSILLLDPATNTLRLGAAPSLPEPYHRAVDGLAVGPSSGSCGTAVHRRDRVVVADIATDPLWEKDRAIALAHGLRACTSVPILAANGEVLGAYAIYYRTPREPGAFDLKLIETSRHLLSLAIERKRAEEDFARLLQREQAANERLQALSSRLFEVQERERRDIARDLHDEIGQILTALKMDLQNLSLAVHASKKTALLNDSQHLVDCLLQQMRDLALNLHPSLLDEQGLKAALKAYVERQGERARVAVEFDTDRLAAVIPPNLAIACFRVAQEALSNVIRHARATRIRVTLRARETALELTVQDDGAGFDAEAAIARAGLGQSLGLLSMQERVHLLGGRMSITSAPGAGTEVRASFPLGRSPNSPWSGGEPPGLIP